MCLVNVPSFATVFPVAEYHYPYHVSPTKSVLMCSLVLPCSQSLYYIQ